MSKRHAISVLLAVSMCGAGPASSKGRPPHPDTSASYTRLPAKVSAAIDQTVVKLVRDGLVSGAAVGISQGGQVKFLKGYGLADLENGIPVTKDTVFSTASMIKQMTAACVLLLAERGKLSVDDPLSKFLPNFPRADEITLLQLMNHTSGIEDYLRPDFVKVVSVPHTRDELLETILDTKKIYEFEPGTSWSYSNSNYILLGMAIEKASGESYEAFLKKNVIDRLKLANTAMDDLPEIVPHRARGYVRTRTPGVFANAQAIPVSNRWAAGGLRSTLGDMLTWQDALLDGRFLSAKSLALMLTPAHLKTGQVAPRQGGERVEFQYGLGMITSEPVEGHNAYGTGGAMPGYNTWIRRVPDAGMTIVVLTNTSGQARMVGGRLIPAIIQAQGSRSTGS